MTLTIKFVGLDKMIRDLQRAQKSAIPYAMRDALNTTAFEARRLWQNNVKATLVMRTPFTVRSIQVDRALGLDTRHMESRVGSIAPYMAEIEQDTTRTGHGHFKPIPTAVAAGMAPGSRRTKLVRASNALRAIQAAKATGGKSRQQRNAVAMAIARKRKEKFVLLERKNGGKGLFQFRPRLAPRMVWDLSRGSVHVRAHKTLEPALAALAPRMEAIMQAALLRQLQRHKVFGY